VENAPVIPAKPPKPGLLFLLCSYILYTLINDIKAVCLKIVLFSCSERKQSEEKSPIDVASTSVSER
jgi:hypothetical protein